MLMRFSVIIQNNKGEYLICGRKKEQSEKILFEFPGAEIIVDDFPQMEEYKGYIAKTVESKTGLRIDHLKKHEMFYTDSGDYIHTIFIAELMGGYLKKEGYAKLFWCSEDKLWDIEMNFFGDQVKTKLSECIYCHFICGQKDELDEFFDNFFKRQGELMEEFEELTKVGIENNNIIYKIAFESILRHLRASLIESPNNKKNITLQNYLKKYKREDLALEIDSLLEIKVKDELTLRQMIKECVDKYIVHYDKPTPESDEIYDFCIEALSNKGKLPLQDFYNLINGYVIGLIFEMWYDAGELGVSMSNRNNEDRRMIIEHRNNFKEKLENAFSSE